MSVPTIISSNTVLNPKLWVVRIAAFAKAHPIQFVLSVILSWYLIRASVGFVDWALIRAVWDSPDAVLCRIDGSGACWAVINARWRIIIFGLYPFEEQWRSAFACLLLVVTGVLSCLPVFWSFRKITALWLIGFTGFVVFMSGGALGLRYVPVREWGGLALTLFVFASVCIITMPLSVALALLRQSKLPLISKTTQAIIDVVRSLPLLVVMFISAVVIPFGLPDWMIGEKLYRLLIGFSLYTSCYQAEIIRSGIQSLPIGQEEAAKALGLGYWNRTFNIILPQAFKVTLPSTINQIVIIFLETPLIVIIGFFEVLASGNAAFGTAEWGIAAKEVYIFIGIIFFTVSLSLSRYGASLEKRLSRSDRS